MILPFVLPKKKEETGRFFSKDDPFMADFFKPRYFNLFCTYKYALSRLKGEERETDIRGDLEIFIDGKGAKN
jgi:hypothetical protein